MIGSSVTIYAPVLGALFSIAVTALGLGRSGIRFRKRILIGLVFLTSISLPIYWMGASRPDPLMSIGLWALKLNGILAVVGLSFLKRTSSDGMRPILQAALGISALAGICMAISLILMI